MDNRKLNNNISESGKDVLGVSIVIPVYNTQGKLLERMLKSVVEQSFDNYEIIIVDDGSTKDISHMLDTYGKINGKIKVYHIKNSGVSCARNYGIEKSSGKYITFVDADDYIAHNFLKDAFEYAEKYQADVVYGTIKYIPEKYPCRQKTSKELDIIREESIDDLKISLLNYKYGKLNYVIVGGPWGKLVKREVLENVKFDTKLKYSEDQIWNRKLLNSARTVISCQDIWYFYEINNQSVMQMSRGDLYYYLKIKPYWDSLYELNKMESDKVRCAADYHALCEYIQLVCIAFVESRESIFNIVKEMKTAVKHPLINRVVCNGLSKTIKLDNKEKIFFWLLKHKKYATIVLAYRLYYKFLLKIN